MLGIRAQWPQIFTDTCIFPPATRESACCQCILRMIVQHQSFVRAHPVCSWCLGDLAVACGAHGGGGNTCTQRGQ